MAIEVLKQEEINEVSGGAITVGVGSALSLSLDPFALLNTVFGLVGAVVNGVVGLVTGLVGTATGLLGGLLGGLFA